MSVIGQTEGIKHGTWGGYKQHLHRKVPMCDECREANRVRKAAARKAKAANRPATEGQKAWNASPLTSEQMETAHRQRHAKKAPAPMPRMYTRQYPPYPPGWQDPAWGVPVKGRDLAVGDTIVHLGKCYKIDRFEPYKGSLDAELGKGARTAYSGTWDMAVGPDRTIRIRPREGR
ncbi:hypothetical protein AB0I81_22510 [Nonomuraea sp. NPDC050404]|uniref:hypothetical protein n=1 Tax=Nonomuraea sp. NPDC050404 TaxID=3155783 RepID=UPI00340B7C95